MALEKQDISVHSIAKLHAQVKTYQSEHRRAREYLDSLIAKILKLEGADMANFDAEAISAVHTLSPRFVE
jgi:hypothetical protein